MAENDAGTDAPAPSGPGPLATLLICAAILAAGGAAIYAIFITEPTAERVGATRQTAMLVDTVPAEAGSFRPTIEATGTVKPAREIMLRPRVQGRVVEHADAFVPGGTVSAGELVVRLDGTDYRQTLRQRRSELEQARAQLRIEQGRGQLAKSDLRLLDQPISRENKALALREPQLDRARARVDSARTAVEQAQTNLDRTRITAPFDATVTAREVNLGSQVATGDALARLVSTDTYWVEATVPVGKLRWLRFGSGGDAATPVTVRDRSAWPKGVGRSGRLFQRVGTLDDATRMARVLIAVDDPLARSPSGADKPALMLGAYVRVRMRGVRLDEVVRIDREHVRSGDTVWVMADGKLAIRDVAIAVRDDTYAYVREGLSGGERIVTSELATIREGAPLRRKGDSAS